MASCVVSVEDHSACCDGHGHDECKNDNDGCNKNERHCHGEDNHCCSRGNNVDDALCLTFVKDNGDGGVVLFDASGNPRGFSYKDDDKNNSALGNSSSNSQNKLCFSTHGLGDASKLMTPCLDDKGNHGKRVEDCFCGVETPHLHAHIHDPKTCCLTTRKEDELLNLLANLTLHANDEMKWDEEEHPLIEIPVSEHMPKQCNSKQVSRCMDNQGIRSSEGCRRRRRLLKVKHDDHFDYLVHDADVGTLHLEHPCDDCGDMDIHGTFQFVGKRSIGEGTQVNVFELSSNPFNLPAFVELFDTQSQRVAAAKCVKSSRGEPCACCSDDAKSNSKNTVQSSLLCNKICCSAEIPVIRSILAPVNGVDKVLVNVSSKLVIVDHDPHLVSAANMAAILTEQSFDSTVNKDGGRLDKPVAADTIGRSQFFVEKICCASEIPAINRIVDPMQGVTKVSINVTNKMVYVDHDTSVVSALEICDALNADRFGAHIRYDAATALNASTLSSFVSSSFSVEGASFDAAKLKAHLKSYDDSLVESFANDGKIFRVVHNPLFLTAQAIADKLASEAGIPVRIDKDGADDAAIISRNKLEEETLEDMHSRPRPTVIMSGIFWVISLFSFIGGRWEYLKYVALVSVLFGLPPIAFKAYRSMLRLRLDANCLMLFAALGAVALQEFTEAAAVAFLFAISEWLEVRATARARNALSAIVQLRPDDANLVHPATNKVVVVPAAAVPVGSVVSVRTGDKVPCDGVVLEGQSTVDESSLTGESRPIRKGPKDKVFGGTINSGHMQLLLRTTSTADNSAVARLIRLVEEAQANRSETEKFVDGFARFYTPIIVVGALLMCTIPWAFGREEGLEWTNNGLILIVVACPCALIISTPVSYVAGLAATAQKGVLIKGGAHLESLGLVKKICFDKTGTLTMGSFALLDLRVQGNGRTRRQVFEFLSVMEERASHPLAQAILTAAKNEGVTIPKTMTVKSHTFLAGEGVSGQVNGLQVYVGNQRLFERMGLLENLPAAERQLVAEWSSKGGTVGFMSIEGDGIVCSYCVADAVRPESAESVAALRKMGIDVMMLTGDNRDAALSIGRQIGLADDGAMSNLLPEEKLSLVEELKGAGSRNSGRSILSNPFGKRDLVLMCGDGVNDAPALAAADVGVAMGAGATLAMETADVTLLDSHLSKLIYSLRMGRRVIRKIQENVLFSITVKFIVLGFALAGKASLWAAIASDVGAMILVTLNGMLLLPRKKCELSQEMAVVPKADVENGSGGECCGSGDGCAKGDALPSGCCGGRDCCSKSTGMIDVEPILPSKKDQSKTGGSSGDGDCCGKGGIVDAGPILPSQKGFKTAGNAESVAKTSCCDGDRDCCGKGSGHIDVRPILPSKNRSKASKSAGGCCDGEDGCCGKGDGMIDVGPILPSKKCSKTVGNATDGFCESGRDCCAKGDDLIDVEPILPSKNQPKTSALTGCCGGEGRCCGKSTASLT